jgi:hypothetical protein
MKINISDFNFTRNPKVIKEIENSGNSLQNIPNIYYKKLGISKKEIHNISIDYILDKLEDAKMQKKIIKYITDYKKIPKKTIDYFKKMKSVNSKEITDNEIKQIIIDYLRLKYNEYSIFNIDIYFIYCEGWNRNCLDEEGPREYIFHKIKEFNTKKSSCIVM